MSGWIKLFRKIFNSDLWIDGTPFDKRSAWIDILLLTNNQDKTCMIDGVPVLVEKGTFITSEVKLANRWQWSRTKVRNFLKYLEIEQMISKKQDKKKTYLKVLHYADYQESEYTKKTQLRRKKNNMGENEFPPHDLKDNNQTSPHKEITNYFCNKHIDVFDLKYAYSGKDGAIIKSLLTTYDVDWLKEAIDWYFDSEDDWIKKCGWTISGLKANLQKYIAQKKNTGLYGGYTIVGGE